MSNDAISIINNCAISGIEKWCLFKQYNEIRCQIIRISSIYLERQYMSSQYKKNYFYNIPRLRQRYCIEVEEVGKDAEFFEQFLETYIHNEISIDVDVTVYVKY